MVEVYVRRNRRTGEKQYLSDGMMEYAPLSHGISRIVGDKGAYVWNDEQNKFLPEDTAIDQLTRGTNQGVAAGARVLEELGMVSPEKVAEYQANGFMKTRETMPSPEMTTSLREAEASGGGILDYSREILQNPLDVGLPLLTESTPAMLGTIGPAILATAATAGYGAVPAIAATVGVGGLASYGLNYGSKQNELLVQEAAKRGINPNDSVALNQLSQDPLVRQAIQQQAQNYSLPVAGMDALSLGVAGPMGMAVRNAATLGRKAAITGAGVASQMAMGGGGEALGQINMSGEITDPMSVAAETMLEIPGGLAEMAGLGFMMSRDGRSNIPELEDTITAQEQQETPQQPKGPLLLENREAPVAGLLEYKGPQQGVRKARDGTFYGSEQPVAGLLKDQSQQYGPPEMFGPPAPQQGPQQVFTPPPPQGPKQIRLPRPDLEAPLSDDKIARVLDYADKLGLTKEDVAKWPRKKLHNVSKRLEERLKMDGSKVAELDALLTQSKVALPSIKGIKQDLKSRGASDASVDAITDDVFYALRTLKLKEDLVSRSMEKDPTLWYVRPTVGKKPAQKPIEDFGVSKYEVTQPASKLPTDTSLDVLKNSDWFNALPQEDKDVVERNVYSENLSPEDTRRRVEPIKDADITAFNTRELQQSFRDNLKTRKFSKVVNLMEERRKRGLNTQEPIKPSREALAMMPDAQLDAIYKRLDDRLEQVKLTDKVSMNVVLDATDTDTGERVDGYVQGRSIVLSLLQSDGRDIMTTLNHELIHSLRNLGAFTPAEWDILERNAPEWRKMHDIDSRYEGLTETELNEEAIAEHFAKTRAAKDTVQVKGIYNKVKKLLTQLYRYLKGIGLQTPQDALWLFEQVDNGRIGERASKQQKAIRNDVLLASKRLKDVDKAINDPHRYTGLKRSIESFEQEKAHINWAQLWFMDIGGLARRVPQLKSLAAAGRARGAIEAHGRQEWLDLAGHFTVENKKMDAADIDRITRASVFLSHNKEKFKGQKEIILNKAIPGYAKVGEKVQVDELTSDALTLLQAKMDASFNAWIGSTMGRLLDAINEISPVFYRTLIKGEMTLPRLEEVLSEKDLPTDLREYVQNVYDITSKAREQYVTDGFYLPKVRESTSFVYVYDKSKPLLGKDGLTKKTASYKEPYEIISVIPVPMNMFGKMPSVKAYEAWAKKRFDEIRETNSSANIHFGSVRNIVKSDLGEYLGDDSFSIVEKLDMLLDPAADSKETKIIFEKLVQKMQERGFAKHMTNSTNMAGYIHGGNKDSYMARALANYGGSLSTRVARNATNHLFVDAMKELREGVQKNTLGEEVLKYGEDYINYINTAPGEFARLRSASYLYFLGGNISSGLLQLAQGPQSSLPVLTSMFGSGTKAAKELTKTYAEVMNVFSKTAPVNWSNFTSADPLKEFNTDKPLQGFTEGENKMLAALRADRTLAPIINEELSAQGEREKTGSSIEIPHQVKTLWTKTSNVLSFFMSRTETANRVAVALAAYRITAKALKDNDTATLDRMKKYFDTTEYRRGTGRADTDLSQIDITITDPIDVARKAVELTQFSNSRFNRAQGFRGALAVPTQFMAFPVKYLTLYLDMLKSSFGEASLNPRTWKNADPVAAKAFSLMLLSLWGTAGLIGMVPFGDPLRDLYDKVLTYTTGINPTLELEAREAIANYSSPEVAELVLRGPFPSISQRTGVGMFGGVNPNPSSLDLLGPTGGLLNAVLDAREKLEQGHTSLAIANMTPGFIRNWLKAEYESDYGIVTRKGNIIPSDYSTGDYISQVIGFAPTDIVRTRNAIYARDSLASATTIAKERYMDELTTLNVKTRIASMEGRTEEARGYTEKAREALMELREYNQANPDKPININSTTLQRRIKEQMDARRGVISGRRVSVETRNQVSEAVKDAYPTGYVKEGL